MSYRSHDNLFNFLLSNTSVTYYVDQVNGDDNNPGTQDAPFQTLQKAIDSVPVGGYGRIYLIGGQSDDTATTYIMDNRIHILNKYIHLMLHYVTLSARVFNTDLANHVIGGFDLDNAFLCIQREVPQTAPMIKNVPKNDPSLPWFPWRSAIIQVIGSSSSLRIHGFTNNDGYVDITVADGCNIVSVLPRSEFATFLTYSQMGTDFKLATAGQSAKFIQMYESIPISFHVYLGTVSTVDGSSASWTDLIGGVVKATYTDSAGNTVQIPINVLSNITF